MSLVILEDKKTHISRVAQVTSEQLRILTAINIHRGSAQLYKKLGKLKLLDASPILLKNTQRFSGNFGL